MKSVDLRTADGQSAGTATFTQARHGVIITLDLRNLTPGPHGLPHSRDRGLHTRFQGGGWSLQPDRFRTRLR